MILEGVRPSNIPEYRPRIAVARDFHDAREVGPTLRRRGHEPGAQAVATECRRIKPGSSGIPLHNVPNAAIRQRLGPDPARPRDRPEYRPIRDAGSHEPALQQRHRPNMPTVRDCLLGPLPS